MSMFDLLDELDESTRHSHPPHLTATQPNPLQYRESGYSSSYFNSQNVPQTSYDPEFPTELPLDAFGKELLRQPHVDRRQLAEQGAARLSLAPQPNSNMNGATAFSNSVFNEPPRRAAEPVLARTSASNFSRFAYAGDANLKSSSSELPSSPALQASQRHPSYAPRMQINTVTAEQTTRENEEFTEPDAATLVYQTHHRTQQQRNVPVVQGILLVERSALPDRFRTIFPFPLFNAVQSQSFETLFRSDHNFVLSSPTGSGKTAILELAICRAINTLPNGRFKVVYQAPTKALCSERQRDWQTKFGQLGMNCAELTGDTEQSQLRSVQQASILITTPEKWDSMTRKWKDHEKLMRLIKLFLIDEVHILKDERGATMEAVVSRMRTVGSDVRFVALSATVPNAEDIATWLGQSQDQRHIPATLARFGEEFRPVILEKHVCGFSSNSNDFAFEKTLNSKLPDIITKYSEGKPIMVFCSTRRAAEQTASDLAQWWASKSLKERGWPQPKRHLQLQDPALKAIAAAGVAFHHAAITSNDRSTIEKAYLNSDLHVICCTSTLAVGVNLPCHLVIVKNTIAWTAQTGNKEYSDLEVMQMLGRAGRPQFDKSGVAVIMTRTEKVKRYETMVSGQDVLESQLHLNLVEHLNAEICLRTITDMESAKRWLAGTFLFVRLQKNPAYYCIEGCTSLTNTDDLLTRICRDSLELLRNHELVHDSHELTHTEYGDAMARYYIQFATMKLFMGLEPQARLSEILSAIAQASEFKEIRFRGGEKPVYKLINQNPLMRMPIQVDLALPGHKVSLIIQMTLGGIDWPNDEASGKFRTQHQIDHAIVFRHLNRLVRCIIDCLLYRNDSVAVRNAFMLERSIGAEAWEDSPLQLKQIATLGPVAVRKLVAANIKSIEDFENTEPHRIEHILGRNPPHGLRLLNTLKDFPRLRVSLKLQHHQVLRNNGIDEGVRISIKADLGFLNEKTPVSFNKKRVYVCLLAERTDGQKVFFARASAQSIADGQEVRFSIILRYHDETITCYVMCEEIAGTLRQVVLKHMLPADIFPKRTVQQLEILTVPTNAHKEGPGPNTSKRRVEAPNSRKARRTSSDDFQDDDLGDEDLAAFAATVQRAKSPDFRDIDEVLGATIQRRRSAHPDRMPRKSSINGETTESQPVRLSNGKWMCSHKCKNKMSCKHMCCREGMDKPPKVTTKRSVSTVTEEDSSRSKLQKLHGTKDTRQSKLNLSVPKKASEAQRAAAIDHMDLTQRRGTKSEYALKQLQPLHNSLHNSRGTESQQKGPIMHHSQPAASYKQGHKLDVSFMTPAEELEPISSDYGDTIMDDLPSPSAMLATAVDSATRGDTVEGFNDTDSIFEAALVGHNDSETLRKEKDYQDDNIDNFALDETIFDICEVDKWSGREPEAVPDEKTAAEEEPTAENCGMTIGRVKTDKSIFVTSDSSSSQVNGRPDCDLVGNESTQLTLDIAREDTESNHRLATTQTQDAEQGLIASDSSHRAKSVSIPPGWEGIDPWLIQEYGSCVEFI